MNLRQTIIYDLAFQETEIYLKRSHLLAKRDEYIGLSSQASTFQELLETLYSYLHSCRECSGYDYGQLFELFKDHIASLRDLTRRIADDPAMDPKEPDFVFFNNLYEDLLGIETRNTLWFRANESTVVRRHDA